MITNVLIKNVMLPYDCFNIIFQYFDINDRKKIKLINQMFYDYEQTTDDYNIYK